MNRQKLKQERKARRHTHARSRIQGTAARPRLSVFRSHLHLYAQLIDDMQGKTIIGITDGKRGAGEGAKQTKTDVAFGLGRKIAEAAKKKGITAVVFDAGGNRFHGRTKRFAEGAREGGLTF